MVEVVAGFEMLLLSRLAVDQARVEQPVGGIQHPDGDEHRDDGRERKPDVVSGCDEPDPQRSHCGRIERKQMPERDERSMVFGVRLLSCGQCRGLRRG